VRYQCESLLIGIQRISNVISWIPYSRRALGQIKQGRGFRQFLLRGLNKVRYEWCLICPGQNLLKLFRVVKHGFMWQEACVTD